MTISGLNQGRVISTTDPLGQGRVRLQVPQVSGRAVSGWAPPVQAGGRLPAVGEIVWVAYQGGDESYPAYVPPLLPPPAPFSPLASSQVSEPSYTPISTWTAFTTAQWPRISFTVPESGQFWVTISGRVRSTVTTESTAWMTWAITGDHVEGPIDKWGLSCANSSRQQSSYRYLVSNVSPGSSITLVPHWYVSSTNTGGNVQITYGQLYVERVGTT